MTAETLRPTSQPTGQGRAPADGRPVIGISTYAEQARWGSWDTPSILLPRRYADSVTRAGGIPVLLPSVPGAEHAAMRLDGLILAGGGDIDPAVFGAQAHPQTGGVRPDRDAAEFGLALAALAHGLPLLGICRGLQVLNVALGGTLHQDLPALVGHDGHSPVEGGYGSHPVTIAPGSRLAGVLGAAAPGSAQPAGIPVPTHHHQAIDRLGGGLVATAWTEDGVIEAVELAESGRLVPAFAMAVQWHPEVGEDPSLFHALVAAAASCPRQA